MKNLNKTLAIKLTKLRKQGLEVSDINPISALADIIYEKLNSGQINKNDINHTLKKISEKLWKEQVVNLRKKIGLSNKKLNLNYKKIDITKPVYQAVFTAHPVFRFSKELSDEIGQKVNSTKKFKLNKSLDIRNGISLSEEHDEALRAIFNARDAIYQINYEVIANNKK